MHHNHDSDGPCAKTPGILPGHLRGLVLVFKLDPKHFGEVLAQAVAGAALDASTSGWYEALYRGREKRPSKLLGL